MKHQALAAAALAIAAAAQPLTLQPCAPLSPAATFTWSGATPRDGSGLCLGAASGASSAAVAAEPCTGAPSQAWAWHADGTVESQAFPGQCWNVFAAGTAVGTPIVLWTCGSAAAAAAATNLSAANDYFQRQASGAILAVEASLCLSSQAAPRPPPGACSSALDCNLNGECDAGSSRCACYKPWGGADCGQMQFLPIAPPAERNGYPGNTPNETTWGGNAIFFGGLWHLFVAEMTNNCTLAQWGSNSQCAHAISATPEGPYERVDVAVGVWCAW
jgi:hypothetical protein